MVPPGPWASREIPYGQALMPDIVPVDHDPFDGADPFEMAAARTRAGVMPAGGRQQQGMLSNIAPAVVQGMIGLPERAMHAAGDLQRTGDVYDPAPAVGAALMTMGGTSFGAPRGALGAGPVKPASAEYRLTPVEHQPEFPKDVGPPMVGSMNPLTRDMLERMEPEQLDRMAFGHARGDIVTLDPKEINIKYKDDLVNPEDKFAKGGMAWARSVDLSEPVKVHIGEGGKFHLEDGHHRWFAAQKTGRPLTAEIDDVKANAINEILKKSKP